MNQLFCSSGYIDLHDNCDVEVDFAKLPPFLRVLLTTDGTVTKSLESFFWEPINVVCEEQQYVVLHRDEPAINCGPGDRVLSRNVVLRGDKTQSVYVYASSLIVTELLESSVRDQLESGRVGVGELLRDMGLETYREILSVGQTGESVWRVYRIVIDQKPFIKIRESFPTQQYSGVE